MKNDNLYNRFDNVYKKNWMAYKYDMEYHNHIWEITKKASIFLVFLFLIGIVYCYVVGELCVEGILCLIILLVTLIVYLVDKRIYAKEYSFVEETKMKCVEATICELLNCSDTDIQKILLFIKKIDEDSKKNTPYIIIGCFLRLISSFLLLGAFIIAETIDYKRIPYPIAGLVIIFFLQEFFHSKEFKSLFAHERYYQKLIRRYKDKIVEKYLGL